ncbi:MAG: hypothetical protein GY730_05940 [bacterium]|nr:hypothetical protein [bacterium]
MLPSAFEIFLQNNKISPSKKIVEFIDDNYQALCKDDLFESIRMIIQNIIFYLTTDFEMKNTSPSFSVKKTIPFTLFMSEILMSENLKDIVLNWLKYLLKSNKLSDAVWFCELVSDLFLSPSFINENDSDYYFFKDLVKKISKKNSLIKSKISQIHLQYNKGLVSKKYYVSLLERLPEADYWPMQNDHLSFNDYLRFPWWKRMGLNNQFRLKSLE